MPGRVSLSNWTMGHSTRSSEAFLRILKTHDIELVADVRRFPGSRRLPQFERHALERVLAGGAVLYHWIPELGGRRKPNAASSNAAWHNASFRAYADHLASEEFAGGLTELLMLAHGVRTVIMCAELLWWRCHRRLIADVLTAIGVQVWHLRGEEEPTRHRLQSPARLVAGVLDYGGGDPNDSS